MKNFQKSDSISGIQVRMARIAADLTIRELAMRTSLNKATIVRIEAGMSANRSSLISIRKELEALGAEFHESAEGDRAVVSFPKEISDQGKG